ncbi:ABC transporter ATP-binding protein [Conexibacter woesei]|uniref:Oligopeptide/dipeptide ABC transporter, ATPase subunit n=1 Tax=Conexibacter woesei (strain DSM 14684 / CCUG 47730 / CIP 108061 / JCM 11494 / NBRC 100937 / ID131577) TaxID=469383 RepID=D3F4Z2_CONWI|nr:oligopeptide/dipeptide ABC transporter ATP-binding protein [Conexibacter woesei]ADB48570.1 oligopeptide/dipeptide ABC transporter, ATPase subunit [Conexibacter woesei DSM 14684]
MSDVLVRARDLRVHFPLGGGVLSRSSAQVRAVDGVELEIRRGETLGLVGESGCGKSTLGRALVRLVRPTGGSVEFDGTDVARLPRRGRGRGDGSGRDGRGALAREMQIVFQDPVGSLNPRMKVGAIVAEGLASNRIGTRASRRELVVEMLERVGLGSDAVDRYPHEFSGGQRQRIVIARALAVGARFVVADEPVSALDVSVQSQVLNLFVRLKRELDLTYVFVAHDLAVVGYVSDRIAVMYLGKIVELGPAQALISAPRHPYTRALLSAVPQARVGARRERTALTGDVPNPIDPPSGCRFRTRCPMAAAICAEQEPPLRTHGDGHLAACHFAEAV